jgi:hypothetical protein
MKLLFKRVKKTEKTEQFYIKPYYLKVKCFKKFIKQTHFDKRKWTFNGRFLERTYNNFPLGFKSNTIVERSSNWSGLTH